MPDLEEMKGLAASMRAASEKIFEEIVPTIGEARAVVLNELANLYVITSVDLRIRVVALEILDNLIPPLFDELKIGREDGMKIIQRFISVRSMEIGAGRKPS